MILLLDTHTYLWQIAEPEKIPKKAMNALNSPKSNLLVSVASLWEIAILVSLGRITLSVPIQKLVEQSIRDAAIQVLPIEPVHLDMITSLPFFHRDPFDRLIIAQAKEKEATIVGKDSAFDRYGLQRVWK